MGKLRCEDLRSTPRRCALGAGAGEGRVCARGADEGKCVEGWEGAGFGFVCAAFTRSIGKPLKGEMELWERGILIELDYDGGRRAYH